MFLVVSIFFSQIAEKRPKLTRTLIVVFIANEESNENPGTGVDGLMEKGKLSDIKNGPLFWVIILFYFDCFTR